VWVRVKSVGSERGKRWGREIETLELSHWVFARNCAIMQILMHGDADYALPANYLISKYIGGL